MELRNFFKSEIIVKKDCVSLIDRCDNYMRLHPGSKLWLRDTDHTYFPIRLESENVPKEDYEEIMSLCPRCGSPILKNPKSNHHHYYDKYRHYYYEDYYEDYGFRFCEYCYALEEKDGWKQTVRLLSYLNRIDSNTKSETSIIKKLLNIHCFSKKRNKNIELNNTKRFDAEKFRIRVLTSNNKLLYLTLNHIRMNVDGELYIEHDNDKSDQVKYAGVYLRERDKNGKRLYQGDIVQFDFISFNGERIRLKGILNYKKKEGEATLFVISDNHNSFPPPPERIINNTIEVIGNIYETPW